MVYPDWHPVLTEQARRGKGIDGSDSQPQLSLFAIAVLADIPCRSPTPPTESVRQANTGP